jgi:hypothetical protein
VSIYYLDSTTGNDRNPGASPAAAWKTLDRAMRRRLKPGDSLLLKRRCTWRGSLRLRGSGTRTRPITVGAYGTGRRPRLVSAALPIVGNVGPVSWWRLAGLELRGARPFVPRGRAPGEHDGIRIHGASRGMQIEDCVVCDVSGAGVVFSASRFGESAHDGWTVKDCQVFNAGTGITTRTPWPPPRDRRRVYRCSVRFGVERCEVHDIAADGIVLHACRDGLVDGCRAWRTGIGRAQRTPVGIWFFLARRCVIQRCESFDNHPAGGHADGGGFDLDGGCVDCVMQYNYSHDNDGAGYLVCSYDPRGAPCARCVTRFNLSVDDGRRNDYASILFWQAEDCLTHNNTCVTKIASCLKFTSDTRGHLVANNLFVVDSAADIPAVQSAFALDRNRFENNLFWRTGGPVSFRLKEAPRADPAEAGRFLLLISTLVADPRLSALSGSELHLQSGSPAAGAGMRLPDLGPRDYYGLPTGSTGPVNVGASLRKPRQTGQPREPRRGRR